MFFRIETDHSLTTECKGIWMILFPLIRYQICCQTRMNQDWYHYETWCRLEIHNKQTNKQPNKQTNNPTNKQTTPQTNKQTKRKEKKRRERKKEKTLRGRKKPNVTGHPVNVQC